MEIHYDAQVDALNIQLNDKPSAKTVEINRDVYLDFDEDGNITSIELLYVARYAHNVQEILYKYSPKMLSTPAQDQVKE
jgi:uncharacterized protein YuzE